MFFDVKLQERNLKLTAHELGDLTNQYCLAAVDQADNGSVELRRSNRAEWFRLKSLALARAIDEFIDNPDQDSVMPYRIFLHTMQRLQDDKARRTNAHRMDYSG